ncbi:MAG: pyrroline-5-carboxylate reductase [Pedosphaera sp.]|nr:pyrroline-5-carboxylate reductase [Pedosphaera sp.]
MSDMLTIGFLGAGQMATALARGFLSAGLVAADRLWASDISPAAREAFARETRATVTASNLEVARASSVLVLAVKPDQVTDLLGEIRPAGSAAHLVLSIAAGVPLSRLEAAAWPAARVIRVMPNTPALVGASASAYARGSAATAADVELAQRLLGSVGLALEVKEKLLDAVTGLSGSGPAYVFQIIEALSDGGVAAGLPRDIATRLAAQTLLGAAKMVLETGQHPASLKDAVCSPGGTTIEGVHELEKGGLRATLMNAVRAAAEKSARLGK